MKIFASFTLIVLTFLSLFAWAQEAPSEAEMEIRAREIGRALRCVVCQNQSIEDSDAVLAEDMRTLVRKRLRDGDSNEQVIEFMHTRYGDFVLLKPPVQSNTYLLWFTPFLLLGVFLIWYILHIRRKPSKVAIGVDALSDEERKRVDALLEADK